MRAPQDTIVDALAIRDDTLHTPDTDAAEITIQDIHDFDSFLIYAVNGLDQAVTLTPRGNIAASTTNKDGLGAWTLSVPAKVGAVNGVASLLFEPGSAWLPFVWVEAQCAVAPASGSLTVTLARLRATRDQTSF